MINHIESDSFFSLAHSFSLSPLHSYFCVVPATVMVMVKRIVTVTMVEVVTIVTVMELIVTQIVEIAEVVETVIYSNVA